VAYGFHPVGSVEAENWVADRAFKILQRKVADVICGLRQGARFIS
jgi:hypothetical protein